MATATKNKAAEGTTENVADEAATEAAAPTVSADEKAKRIKAARPTYGIQKVSKIPENAKIKRGPSNRDTYRDLLLPVTEDESLWGEWLQIAEFNTSTGARMKMKDFTGTFDRKTGERLSEPKAYPPGEGFVWEFAARRLERDNGEKYSVLYAKCEPSA